MLNQQLIECITKARVAGQSNDEIRAALLGAGWQPLDVDEVLSAAVPAHSVAASRSPKVIIAATSIIVVFFLGGGGYVYYYFFMSESKGKTSQITYQEQQSQISISSITDDEKLIESNINEPWRLQGFMQKDRYYHAAAVGEGYLFISGGFSYKDIPHGSLNREDIIEAMKINSDGSLLESKIIGKLPRPFDQHAMVIVGKRLYISGDDRSDIYSAAFGRYEKDKLGTVISAEILKDGQIGDWRKEVSLPEGKSSHQMRAMGNIMIVFGGEKASTIYTSIIGADGILEPWQQQDIAIKIGLSGGGIVGNRLYLTDSDVLISYFISIDGKLSDMRSEVFPGNRSTTGSPHNLPAYIFASDKDVFYVKSNGVTFHGLVKDNQVNNWQGIPKPSEIINGGFATAFDAQSDTLYVTGGYNGVVTVRKVAAIWSHTALSAQKYTDIAFNEKDGMCYEDSECKGICRFAEVKDNEGYLLGKCDFYSVTVCQFHIPYKTKNIDTLTTGSCV